jgi:hypothetical protein
MRNEVDTRGFLFSIAIQLGMSEYSAIVASRISAGDPRPLVSMFIMVQQYTFIISKY